MPDLNHWKAEFLKVVPRNPDALRKTPHYLAISAKLNRSGLFDISPLDILSEVWMAGVQSIERGKPIKKADAWIYTVALRMIAQKIPKKGQRKIYFVEYNALIDERVASGDSGEKIYTEYDDASNPQYQQVRQAMQQLNPQDLELLELTLLDGYSYADIAAHQVHAGKPPIELAALRKQKSRALKKLKDSYDRLG